jgi:hypothetical protein
MNANPVELGPVLREGVDASLKAAPVILVAPVGNERLSLLEGDALRPVADGFPLRPAGLGQSPPEIVECGLGYSNLEGCHGFRRWGKHEFRDLVGVCTGSFRDKLGGHRDTTACRSRTQELAARVEGRRYFRPLLCVI